MDETRIVRLTTSELEMLGQLACGQSVLNARRAARRLLEREADASAVTLCMGELENAFKLRALGDKLLDVSPNKPHECSKPNCRYHPNANPNNFRCQECVEFDKMTLGTD